MKIILSIIGIALISLGILAILNFQWIKTIAMKINKLKSLENFFNSTQYFSVVLFSGALLIIMGILILITIFIKK